VSILKIVHLTSPLSLEDVESLELGNFVYITGQVFTCRGRFQQRVIEEGMVPPIDTTKINIMIHVGPIVKKTNGSWEIVSMQPTTSNRYEKWGASIIETLGLRMIIGKGTMGPLTAIAMQKCGCVHLTPVGVMGAIHSRTVQVKEVYWFDLGPIEATWVLEANDLGPFQVDIDAKGNRYFEDLDQTITRNRKELYQQLGIPEDFKYADLKF